jgi:tetratricopeptide (TPR) repeat protein
MPLKNIFLPSVLVFAVAIAGGFARALMLNGRPPGLSPRYLDRAEAARRRGDSSAAARLYKGYLGVFPYDFRARTFLGKALINLGQWQAAVTELEVGQGLNPYRKDLFAALARAHLELSRDPRSPDRARNRELAELFAVGAIRLGADIEPSLRKALGISARLGEER